MESMQNITIRDAQAEDAMTLRTVSVSKPKSSQQEDESASAEKVSITYSKSTVKRSRDMPKKAQAYKTFIEGQVLLKYGKFGYPKQKHVYFDGERLRWRANTNEGHSHVEKSGELTRNFVKDKYIPMSDAHKDYGDLKFFNDVWERTILRPRRGQDSKASDEEEADIWVGTILGGREGKVFKRFKVSKEESDLSFQIKVKNKNNEWSRELCL